MVTTMLEFNTNFAIMRLV